MVERLAPGTGRAVAPMLGSGRSPEKGLVEGIFVAFRLHFEEFLLFLIRSNRRIVRAIKREKIFFDCKFGLGVLRRLDGTGISISQCMLITAGSYVL